MIAQFYIFFRNTWKDKSESFNMMRLLDSWLIVDTLKANIFAVILSVSIEMMGSSLVRMDGQGGLN